MAILPIDIQTIIAQLNRVGQTQHNVQNAPLAQQHHYGNVIEQQSMLNDNQVNQTQQTDSQDKKVNPDTKKEFGGRKEFKKRAKEQSTQNEDEPIVFKDPDKGNIIDVKK